MSLNPVRKALLYVIDPATGKTYAVKVTLTPDGVALIPASIEKDAVGLATESTLSGIKAQTDKLTFDSAGRLYIQNPPALDVALSTVRDNMNLNRIGNVPLTGEDWTPHIKYIDNLATEQNLNRMTVEGLKRCFDVTIDDAFAVPAGQVWYAKSLYITSGSLYLDGDVKVI
jgi:hypothetical protein